MTERFGAGAVSLAGNIALAYLLTPDDMGLVSMLGIFTALVYALVDCGLSDALLRDPSPTDRDFNTLFFFNAIVGVCICLLFVTFAPAVARFYGRPELRAVMSVLGVSAVFSALTIAQVTRLRSRLRFRRVALYNILSIALALVVAMALAFRGMGYWALVALQVGFPAFYWLLLALTTRWHLRWEFDTERFAELWRFGANLLLSTIAIQLSQNILAVVLGRFYGATRAGHLGQAQKLQQSPVGALEVSVSNATYVLVAKEDAPQRQDQAFLVVFRRFSLVLALACTLGVILSPKAIEWIFPPRWLPVVPCLQWLLIWSMIYPVSSFMAVMLKLRDRTAAMRNLIIAERATIVAAAVLLHRWGLAAMIAAFCAISTLALLAYMWQCARVSSLSFRQLLAIYLLRSLPAIAVALCVVWAM